MRKETRREKSRRKETRRPEPRRLTQWTLAYLHQNALTSDSADLSRPTVQESFKCTCFHLRRFNCAVPSAPFHLRRSICASICAVSSAPFHLRRSNCAVPSAPFHLRRSICTVSTKQNL
ncbi:hypothetical protein WMY93_012663 [Mugilogobius chulae]|uniref:Uncharacterized protein n=1 Tax=Mugilogobius chulae TaxID=88201 RepID=A0AAW0P6V7_9GOBI